MTTNIYIYQIELTNGKTHDIQTPHHHADHSYDQFKQLILPTLANIVAGVATHHISNIKFKGKK